jgi:hypothetical protein
VATHDPEAARNLDEVRIGAAKLLEFRNRQVGHLDLPLSVQPEEEQPQLFTWVGMLETQTSLPRWMNAFELSHDLPPLRYLVEEEWTDVDQVKHLLRKAASR